MTFFFFSSGFVLISCRNFFQSHILMFSCLHAFLCSHVTTFSWFLSLHTFSCSLVPTRVLLLSRLYMFSRSLVCTCFFLCSYCNYGVLLVIMTSLYNINESLNHGFLNCFSNLRIFFYYSNPPLVLKILKVLKHGFLTDFEFQKNGHFLKMTSFLRNTRSKLRFWGRSFKRPALYI